MKLINFVKDKDFKPMLNPMEMISCGIHGGAFGHNREINPKLIAVLVKNDISVNSYDKIIGTVLANYFNANALSILNPLITNKIDDVNEYWFVWYIDYYYDHRRADGDRIMIDHWKMVMELWKEKMTNSENQTFLEYGWWYTQNPNKWLIL